MISLLLYVDSTRFDGNENNFILSASITQILETERFSTSLFQGDVLIFYISQYLNIAFHLHLQFSINNK